MPQVRPRMKARPTITRPEPRIRMPDWRSASPKKPNTRPLKTFAVIRARKRQISPKDSTQSRGTLSQVRPISRRARAACGRWSSLDHRDLGVRGQQRLREDVVEREDRKEGDHHALVHGSAHALGAARGGHALVTGDDRRDRAE